MQVQHSDYTEIIHAKVAYPLPQAGPHDASRVFLRNVHIYEIGHDSGQADQALSGEGMVLSVDGRSADPPAYSSLAASSLRLAASHSPDDVAELQWRLSTPVSTLLLGMLGYH